MDEGLRTYLKAQQDSANKTAEEINHKLQELVETLNQFTNVKIESETTGRLFGLAEELRKSHSTKTKPACLEEAYG